jgi:uncharacterized protein DUF3617
MKRQLLTILVGLVGIVTPALAFDPPARKPGLWELKMEFPGRDLPVQMSHQCTDATSDKLMTLNFGGAMDRNCTKQDPINSGGKITVDSVCTFGAMTTKSHSVVSGDFNSAYTVEVASTREGGPPVPGVAPGTEMHMTIAAKWVGACEAGQKPGDVIMANGMKMNVFDLQKMGEKMNAPPPKR